MEMLTKHDPMFTPRILEILELIAHPYSRKQICEILGMNKRTLDAHIVRIMDRTRIHDYVELIAFAQAQDFGAKIQGPHRNTEPLSPSMLNTTQKTGDSDIVTESPEKVMP